MQKDPVRPSNQRQTSQAIFKLFKIKASLFHIITLSNDSYDDEISTIK